MKARGTANSMTHRALATASAALALACLAPAADAAAHPADHSFLVGSARNNLAEIAGAKLALAKSHDPGVRSYAHQILADHTLAQIKLKAAAKATHTTLPTEPSTAQQREAAQLKALPEGRFNRRYFSRQIVGHRKAMGAILLELHMGAVDPALRYARWIQPIAENHMDMARKDLARMERSG
jgi:putative membrane protein